MPKKFIVYDKKRHGWLTGSVSGDGTPLASGTQTFAKRFDVKDNQTEYEMYLSDCSFTVMVIDTGHTLENSQ